MLLVKILVRTGSLSPLITQIPFDEQELPTPRGPMPPDATLVGQEHQTMAMPDIAMASTADAERSCPALAGRTDPQAWRLHLYTACSSLQR